LYAQNVFSGAEMAEDWYYAEGNETVGPVGIDELLNTLTRRRDAPRVLVWREGFQDWAEVASVPELSRTFVRPPPLPSRQQAVPAAAPTHRPISPLSSEYRQAASSEKTQRNWSHTIFGGVSVAISLLLSRILGAVFWMPVLLIAISFWGFTKLKLRDYAAIMLGILVGHTLWMIIGHLAILGQNKSDPDLLSFSFDFLIVLILTIWGLKTQSVAMSVGVLIYQIFALGTNVVLFDEISKVSTSAAFVHIGMRALGVGAAIYAILRARRFKREEKLDEPLTV
jgi:hypothetical protein